MRSLPLSRTTPLLLVVAAGCLSSPAEYTASPPPPPVTATTVADEPAVEATEAELAQTAAPSDGILDTGGLSKREAPAAEPSPDPAPSTPPAKSRPSYRSPSGSAGLMGGGRARGDGAGVGRLGSGPSRPEAKPKADAYGRVYERASETITGDFEGREDHRISSMRRTAQESTSTFAVDVDTAAYSIARRSLQSNRMPTPTLVRVEEFINFFRYDYDPPSREAFSIQLDGARSPVDASKHFIRVGLQSKVVSDAERLPTNLVFLMDTSCSMTSGDKLALAKKSMEVALEHLGAKDQVAITTYAGGVSMILPPTRVTDQNRGKILRAMRSLQTSGGTAMASGITFAYQQAAQMLAPNTNTRIVVMSDGDANIGATSPDGILAQVKGYVSEGVRISTIGFGDGNYKDAMMEKIANAGNGNYFYVDSLAHADRVFGRDLTKMVQDVAQDVKIQVEFDAAAVRSWRLVGYENRHIANEDFRNDTVDAGEIGAGHQVTALYEVELEPQARGNLATVRVRSKVPGATRASEVERTLEVARVDRAFTLSSNTMKVAVASMATAELLRHSPWSDAWTFDRVASILEDLPNRGRDETELLGLVKKAKSLSGSRGERLSQY